MDDNILAWEINDRRWHGARTFRDESLLRFYLGTKQPHEKYHICRKTTLRQVFESLRSIILRERLYDPDNTQIVIADQALELALSVPLFDIKQMHSFIEQQLVFGIFEAHTPNEPRVVHSVVPVKQARLITFGDEGQTLASIVRRVMTGAYQGQSGRPQPVQGSYAVAASRPKHYGPKNLITILVGRVIPSEAFFLTLTPEFLAIMHSLEHVSPMQTLFSWQDVIINFSKYVLKNPQMFDRRNDLICHCGRDSPLGKAFKVAAFHRLQVPRFLLAQVLTPADA